MMGREDNRLSLVPVLKNVPRNLKAQKKNKELSKNWTNKNKTRNKESDSHKRIS